MRFIAVDELELARMQRLILAVSRLREINRRARDPKVVTRPEEFLAAASEVEAAHDAIGPEWTR